MSDMPPFVTRPRLPAFEGAGKAAAGPEARRTMTKRNYPGTSPLVLSTC